MCPTVRLWAFFERVILSRIKSVQTASFCVYPCCAGQRRADHLYQNDKQRFLIFHNIEYLFIFYLHCLQFIFQLNLFLVHVLSFNFLFFLFFSRLNICLFILLFNNYRFLILLPLFNFIFFPISAIIDFEIIKSFILFFFFFNFISLFFRFFNDFV